MVRILGFHCCGPGSVPGQGTEIPPAALRGPQTNKQKLQIINYFGSSVRKKRLCTNAVKGMIVAQVAYNTGLVDGLYLEV